MNLDKRLFFKTMSSAKEVYGIMIGICAVTGALIGGFREIEHSRIEDLDLGLDISKLSCTSFHVHVFYNIGKASMGTLCGGLAYGVGMATFPISMPFCYYYKYKK